MKEIIDLLLTDLGQVGIVYGIFACAYISNILFSIRLNVHYLDKDFDKSKLLNSLWNALCIILGTLTLVASIDLLTIFGGVENTQLGEFVTVATVLVTIGKATAKYIAESYTTLLQILDIEK